MSTLKLYDLAPSPNNIKVRVALGFKGLEYERIPVDPADRAELIRVSGQPLAPVLLDGETVIIDSHSILRYLDANYRDRGPRLYSEDRAEMQTIERWELAARSTLSRPVGMIFSCAFAESFNPSEIELANQFLHEATAPIEEDLAHSDWLVADRMTGADICCACLVSIAMVGEAYAAASPVMAFFKEHLALGEGREKTRAWVERVMAWDA